MLERGDFTFAPAEDREAVARRGEAEFGGAQFVIGRGQSRLALLPVLECRPLGEVKRVFAPFLCFCERGLRTGGTEPHDGGDQLVLTLHDLGCLDRQQRRALLRKLAGLGENFDDSPGIRGKDRRHPIAVNRNFALSAYRWTKGQIAHHG